MKKNEWDYSVPDLGTHCAQEYWNQTLVTWFNLLTNEKRGFFKLGKYKVVYVPDIYEDLIKSLLFFNEEKGVLANKFFINFYDGYNSDQYDYDYIYFPYSNYDLLEKFENINPTRLKILNFKKVEE